ncbi:metallophosphoesterase family protein [Paenibacillus illinoisensis]|uniref:metallophosphoesterase family protein n=1 Tax=Paenibacillus illinoisensis TaxID=59845 RepID=UPI0030199293
MYKSVAIISDVHSNYLALEAVLQDIAARNIDLIVNLGDSLFGPIDPLATARLLMDQENIVHVMGNCDETLLQKESSSETFQFVRPLLDQGIENWIRSFQHTWAYEELLFCHGTPWEHDQYFLEEVTAEGVRYKDTVQLANELLDVPQRYIFCGHSHVFQTKYLPENKVIVNVGSVGLPAYHDDSPYPHVMESNSPYADYAIAYRNAQGNWNMEHVMVEYDWERASFMAQTNGREDYAVAIRTGRMA